MCATINSALLDLNSNPNLDFLLSHQAYLTADENINPFDNLAINSIYYDATSFISAFRNNFLPIIININIQSLSRKIENLKQLIASFLKHNITIPVIALQEIWQIPYPETVSIQGYNFVFKQRSAGRGGGGVWVSFSCNLSHIKSCKTYPPLSKNRLSPYPLK